jgi:hypothetical protein
MRWRRKAEACRIEDSSPLNAETTVGKTVLNLDALDDISELTARSPHCTSALD